MNKTNMNNDEVKKHSTRDLAAAAYLRTKGVPLIVDVIDSGAGRRGRFSYSPDAEKLVEDFYKGDDGFLMFSMNIRTLKSEVQNKKGGD